MSEKKLQDLVAVISGASKGLGKSMAEALAAEGVKIALVARSAELLDAVAAEIRATGGVAETFVCDVTNQEAVTGLTSSVVDKFGKVDILINNAGMNNRKHLVDFELAEWNEILSTNLTSAFLMSQAFIPHMTGRSFGRIINMTSIMSHVAIAGRTGYCTTKFGLLGFTKALSMELLEEGITVNGISPGPFATEMNKPILEDAERNAQFLSRIPLGRWGKPEEVGSLAVYLCSPDAGFITGADIVIDGGWTVQ
ncbi:MAG: SDR family NAD(P)-dependent oxidoreductase [Verrucomicrobiia bacterium]|jgi:NAD(P)-dependent dehydrogenase (short-subunit alcohol dehydrogenase family)